MKSFDWRSRTHQSLPFIARTPLLYATSFGPIGTCNQSSILLLNLTKMWTMGSYRFWCFNYYGRRSGLVYGLRSVQGTGHFQRLTAPVSFGTIVSCMVVRCGSSVRSSISCFKATRLASHIPFNLCISTLICSCIFNITGVGVSFTYIASKSL